MKCYLLSDSILYTCTLGSYYVPRSYALAIKDCKLFSCSELSGKELVAEMVYSFLLPEVEKETMRRRGKNYHV